MPGIRQTDKYIRARQNDPGKYDKMRKGSIGGGIDVIYGIKDGKSEVQSYLFPRSTWNTERVKEWLSKHGSKGASELDELEYGKIEFDEIELTDAELVERGIMHIELSEKCDKWNEVCFEGVWPNSNTGKDITITEKTIDNMIANFYCNARGLTYRDPVTGIDSGKPTVNWDYGHESGKASAGWIAELEKRDKELPTGKKVKALWVRNYAWTPAAQAAYKAGEWLFSSVDFNDFYDSVKGKTYKDVLFGVALTNRPAVKYCAPVQMSEPAKGAPGGDEPEHQKGAHTMLAKLRALLVGQGVNLAEGVADDTIEYAAVEKIRGQAEIITLSEKKVKELSDAKSTAETKLAEVQGKLDTVEAEKKALAEAEMTKKKSALEEAAKKAYTPAQLAEGKTVFQDAMKKGDVELAEKILAEKGVAFKETRKDEGEKEMDEDEGEADMTKDWDNQSGTYKDAKIEAYMKEKKMDEEEKGAYNKAEVAVAKAHNQKYAEAMMKAKKAGKK